MESDDSPVARTVSDTAHPLAERAQQALLNLDLITPADISNNRVRIQEQGVATGAALVTCGEQSWIAKHAGGPVEVDGDWRAELAVYRSAPATGDRTLVPDLVTYSNTHQLMLTEVLDERWLRLDQSDIRSPWSVEIFARVATSVALWHQASQSLGDIQSAQPWLLKAMRPDHASVEASPDFHELFSGVLANASLRSSLEEIKRSWTRSHVVHGDLRLAIVRYKVDGGVRLLDWKHSGWGDPRWDLAGLLQELHSAEIQHGIDTSAHRSAVLSAYGERATSHSALSEDDPTLQAFVAGRLIARALRLQRRGGPADQLVEAHLNAARAMR